MTKSRGILAPRRAFSAEEIAYLRDHFPNTQTRLVAAALGRSEPTVNGKAYKLGLKKTDEYLASPAACRLDGVRGGSSRFVKGQAAWNHGKKLPGHGNPATFFQAGHKGGSRAIPVGGHRINPDGYVEVKLNDNPGPYTVRWKPVHRLVWEQAHGPIPDGHVVVFRPGMHTTDPAAISIASVECISNADLMRRNTYHRHGPEIAKVVQLRGAITRQINKRAKETP